MSQWDSLAWNTNVGVFADQSHLPTVGSGTESVGDCSRSYSGIHYRIDGWLHSPYSGIWYRIHGWPQSPYSGIRHRIHGWLQSPLQWDPVQNPWVTTVAPTVGSGTESMGDHSLPYSGIRYRIHGCPQLPLQWVWCRIHGWPQSPLQWDPVQYPWVNRSRPYSVIRYRIHGCPQSPLQWHPVQNQ